MSKCMFLAVLMAAGSVLANTVEPTSKVVKPEGYTEYQFPIRAGVTPPEDQKDAPQLVIIVPDTTVPLQEITIINRTPPAVVAPVQPQSQVVQPAPILPGNVKSAEQAMDNWPFAKVLANAKMVFDTPETIKLGKSIDLSLIIDLQREEDKLQKDLGTVTFEGAPVEIKRIVVATILAPDFSVIEAVDKGRQVLDLEGITEWRWVLTPDKLGEYKINVTVSALIEIGDDRAERLVKVFDRDVAVFVTPADAAKLFFSRNWQWLWSGMVFPFGLWYWKNRRKKKAAAEADEEESSEDEENGTDENASEQKGTV